MKTPEPALIDGGRAAALPPLLLAGALLATAIVVLVYWPSLDNGFVWDDQSYLVNAPTYRDPALWFEALFQPPTGQAVFRPLTLLSFALPLWLGFTAASFHHLLNLAIHAASVILLTLLAWRLCGPQFIGGITGAGDCSGTAGADYHSRAAGADERSHTAGADNHGRAAGADSRGRTAGAAVAALTGLVYGLHPALSESVLWIACRFDLMMTFFLLLVLLAGQSSAAGARRSGAVAGGLFLCALLCKETAVGFMLALPLFHLAVASRPGTPLVLREVPAIWRQHAATYAGLLGAFVVYLALRYAILGPSFGLGKVMTRFDEIGTFAQRTIVVAASMSEFIADVLWPTFNVAPNRVLVIPVEGMERIATALAVAGGVAVLAVVAVLRSAGAKSGLLVLAFMAALLPVSNILPAPTYPGELQIAVRYITFPLVFVCLGLCALVPVFAVWPALRKRSLRKVATMVVAAWLVVSVYLVRGIIPLWQNEGVFFSWAIALAPPNSWAYLYINLGSYYANHGEMARAREAFAEAVAAKSRSPGVASLAWYSLGNAEEKLGNLVSAREIMRAILVVDPDNIYARASLARLERNAGNAEAAAAVAAEGLRRAGISSQAATLLEYQLGMALLELKRFDAAADHLGRAVAAARDPQLRAEAVQALEQARAPGH